MEKWFGFLGGTVLMLYFFEFSGVFGPRQTRQGGFALCGQPAGGRTWGGAGTGTCRRFSHGQYKRTNRQFPFFQKLSVSLVSKVVSFPSFKSCPFLFFQKLLFSLLSKVVSFSSFKSCQFPFFQKLSVSLVSKVVISSCIKSCQFLLCQKLLVSLVSKVVSFSCIKSC